MEKIFRIKGVATLKRTYPYQFKGPDIGLAFYRGWFPVVVSVCKQIDARLGSERENFQWSQIKEKLGTLRIYYSLHTKREDLKKDIEKIRHAGEVATQHACMACGRHADTKSYGGWIATLCKRHQPNASGLPMSQYRMALRDLIEVPEG